MKKYFLFILAVALMAATVSCKKDNYDPPSVSLTGSLVYNGEALGVEHDKVNFEVYQYGFGKTGAIGGTFKQDGSYSILLFDGEYKMIIPNGQGAFQWRQKPQGGPDTLLINLNGNQHIDLEVTPYYIIRNQQITASGGKLNASFSIEKIITDASARNIENVTLYVNRTQFVSGTDNNGAAGINGADITDPSSVNLSVDIPNIVPAQNYVFARIGLKVDGLEDRIYSPLVKVSF